MDETFIEDVYDTLQGVLAEWARVPGVENLFEAGCGCERWYADMLDAYERLCIRLGVEEDEDVEVIVHSLLAISREMGCKMYQYGAMFERKGNN